MAGCGGEATPTATLEEQLIQKLIEDEITNNITQENTIENEILAKFIPSLWFMQSPEDYVIVNPETSIYNFFSYSDWENLTARLKTEYSRIGYEISELIDKFFEINSSPSLLTIKSSMNERYYINHDGKFYTYQMEVGKNWYQKGSGWLAFIDEYFPHFNSFLDLSKPAYDPETGYVLIYEFCASFWGTSGHGSGYLCLMKYQDGNLTEVDLRQITAPSMGRWIREPEY